MNKFFDEENKNKIYNIILENIKQHKDYNESHDFKQLLNNSMSSVYHGFPNENLINLNKQLLQKIIPEIINNLNQVTEHNNANKINNYINNNLIPNIEMNMDPKYMSLESRKLYNDTSSLPINNRNIIEKEPVNMEPKDLYKENNDNRVILEKKKESELNSNNKLLDITSNIYNKISKKINFVYEFLFTINTANRDSGLTPYNFSNDTKIVVKFNNKSTATLNDIHISGTNFKNIIIFELNNISIPINFPVSGGTATINKYGVKAYSPIIVVKTVGETVWKVHPHLFIEIEQLPTNIQTSSNKRFFCKINKPSSNGVMMNFKIIGGKKIFRRTEIIELKQLNINILDSNGNNCILGYGSNNIVTTANPSEIGTSVLYNQNISMDFKITRLEPDLENYELNIS